MSTRCKPLWALLGLVAGVTGLVCATPAKADVPWADTHYGYRRPLSIATNVGAAMNAGDVVAYALAPNAGPFLNKTRPDGKDIKLFYTPDGTTNVEPKQLLLPMGTSARILFALEAGVPAPPPYALTETVAGKTAYSSLPAGAAITFSGNDDAVVTKTLPFPVTLRDRTSNQITISIDGYVALGATDPGRPDLTHNGSGSYIMMPFQSDMAIKGTGGQNVFYDVSADNTTVTIRWEVQPSITDQVDTTAKFACVIKSDGTIRFVYGEPCQMPPYADSVADPAIGYDPIRYGIGVGDATKSVITQPAWDAFEGVQMTGHNDITYTQTSSTQTIDGYWVYYGYDADTGARTAPTAGLQGCDFSDGQLHGWKSINMAGLEGTATADVRINSDASYGNELRFEGGQALPLYFLPFMYWGDMTPVANAISYVKLRSNGQHSTMHRFNTQTFTSSQGGDYPAAADVPGIGAMWNEGGVTGRPLVSKVEATESDWKGQLRRHTVPDGFGTSINYSQPSISTYQYEIVSTVDNASNHTIMNAKAWPSTQQPTEPSGWSISGDSSTKAPAVQPLPAGRLALHNYSTVVYVKWAYVLTNPYAESLQYTAGTEATIVAPPAILNGVVTERFSHTPQVGANVTVYDVNGNYVKSTTTDITGAYSVGIATAGSYNVGATVFAGYGARTASPITLVSGQTVTQNLVTDVLVNGDMEIPNANNSKPDSWDWHTRWTNATTDTYGYTREQNHTPGGVWALKFQNPNPQSSGTPDNIEVTAGSGTDIPLIPCDVTLSAWVRSDTADLGVRIRTFTAGWEGAGANGDGSANGGGQWKRFKATPNLAAGELPLNTWVQIQTTNHYGTNPVKGVNICFYGGDFLSRTVSGNVYVDDVAITVTPKYQIITQVVDDLGQPIANPWLGTMKYGTMFTSPAVGSAAGRKYDYFYTTTPVTYAAWQGPVNRSAVGLDASGALVATRTITPVAYEPVGLPTATLVVSRKAVNVLGGTNTTTGLLNGDSQFAGYLIDKRILKTSTASPGDDTLLDSANPADWVQVRRLASGDPQAVLARAWDGNINDEAHAAGTGGIRGILSSGVDAAPSTNDVPSRYNTSTFDIDMGATQSIDQLELGYFFAAKQIRVWVSDTPFSWNVDMPDSQAVVNTTTDAVSVATQGFTSTNKPYDSSALGAYVIFRLPAPAKGRYLRLRQDGAPYGDANQILLEMRAMHSTAIGTADVTDIIRIAAGLQAAPLTADPQFARLDVDGNGTINMLDAVKASLSIIR